MRKRKFFNLHELNHAITLLLNVLNARAFKKLPGNRRRAFEQIDLLALGPLPAKRFELFRWKSAKVNIDYHVEFEGHYYSVPHALVRTTVELCASDAFLRVHDQLETPSTITLKRASTITEICNRQTCSLHYQLKVARFPIHRDLTGLDWSETPLPQAQVEQLVTGACMESAHNLILVGGTGTGKTHVATALGVAAIPQGKRVRFFNAVDLVNQLEREKLQGKTGNLAKQLVQIDAVILDELGYLPFAASGGALLCHLIS